MKNEYLKTVIFTDLDGTLLNDNYGFEEFKPMVKQLLSLEASVVVCSSKTKAEIEFYTKEMGIVEPFVVENGSAILIPKGYFHKTFERSKQTERYDVIELGISYSTARLKLAKIRRNCSAEILGFGDMAEEEIAAVSGLPLQLAKLAKLREYDEPFRILNGEENQVLAAITQEGLNWTRGGRFFHLLGKCDKGKAVTILKDLYLHDFGKIISLGVGDSLNDQEMLQVVDLPFKVGNEMYEKDALTVWRNILKLVREKRYNLKAKN